LCFVKKSIVILKSLESLKLQTNLKTTKEFEYNFETRFEKRRRENLLNFWAQPKTLSSFFSPWLGPNRPSTSPPWSNPTPGGFSQKVPIFPNLTMEEAARWQHLHGRPAPRSSPPPADAYKSPPAAANEP
jgi:hypothetical protein